GAPPAPAGVRAGLDRHPVGGVASPDGGGGGRATGEDAAAPPVQHLDRPGAPVSDEPRAVRAQGQRAQETRTRIGRSLLENGYGEPSGARRGAAASQWRAACPYKEEGQMSCISCGMPLRTDEDHAAGDPTKNYCKHCARPDGSLKSYDE